MSPDYPRIYLQPNEAGIGQHTWCQDRIEDTDIEYVRSDIADELTALTAKVALLTEALRPFAEMAGDYDPDEGDDADLAWIEHAKIGWLRAARRALSEPDKEGP